VRNAVWVDELTAADAERVRDLLLAAKEADGRPEITPDDPLPFGGDRHLLVPDDADPAILVGYANLDTRGDAFGRQVAELIVRPDNRGRGQGTAMVRALVEEAGVAAESGDRLRVWAHGDHPAAARIAERAGFTRVRELLVMHVAVADAQWPGPVLPEGVTLRTFVPGEDEQAVIDVNARAFSWHPEQAALTVDQLRAEEQESWFDAAGFFLAERDGQVIGFHWTKVHPADPDRFGGEPVGEVYVVGVDPGAQGGGLGKALTLAGLRHLRQRGLGQVILYVEGDNAPAVAVYTRLGFTRHAVDVQYAH
jgi:mycothiol synthase